MGIDVVLPKGNIGGMEALREYLNSLDRDAQEDFAKRCSTTLGYLRKAISVGQKLGDSLAISIERESAGEVTCEAIRPDVDWGYLRGSARRELSTTSQRCG